MANTSKDNKTNLLTGSTNISRRIALGSVFGAGTLALTAAFDKVFAQNAQMNRKKVKRYLEQKAAREATEPPKTWLDSILPQSATPQGQTVQIGATPLLSAARLCLQQGNIARTYCLERVAAGDKSVEPCLKAIQAMLPVCSALGKLEELKANRVKEMAKVSLLFLQDCQTQCQKLSQTHVQLAGCALACGTCRQECTNTLRA